MTKEEELTPGSSTHPVALDQAPQTREALYELVWSEPMLKIAARFGVSSSYMARVCSRLNVPRPDRGYWAKLAVGRAPSKPVLRDPSPGDPAAWSPDGSFATGPRVPPKVPDLTTRRTWSSSKRKQLQYDLLIGAKELFDSGSLSYEVGYLKPAKKLLLDLIVTKSGLDRGLSFANQLFVALEARGHHVVIASNSEHFWRPEVDEHEKPAKNRNYNNLWSPLRCTVVYIGTAAIGLTVIEMSEEAEARYIDGKYVRVAEDVPKRRSRYLLDRDWTTTRDFPTGRLCLQAYSPYPRAKWSQQWREAKGQDMTNRIPAIVGELENAVVEVVRLVEEGERQAEVERERWEAERERCRRDEAVRQKAKALQDSKEELTLVIEAWSGAKAVEAFFNDAAQHVQELPVDQREPIKRRLLAARQLIGNTDALERLKSWRTPEERKNGESGFDDE